MRSSGTDGRSLNKLGFSRPSLFLVQLVLGPDPGLWEAADQMAAIKAWQWAEEL